MSGLLASCASLLIGLVVGAAVQRWGDKEKAQHGHKPDLYREYAARWEGW